MEKEELENIYALIQNSNFLDHDDTWQWEAQGKTGFTVRATREMLTKQAGVNQLDIFPWNKKLPLKINIFGWRLWLNRLPTRISLSHRNMVLDNLNCPFCEEDVETLDHLFTGCCFSLLVWSEIEKWCHLPPIIAFSTKDLLIIQQNVNGSIQRKMMVQAVMLISCRVIWKSRNIMVFNCKRTKIEEVLGEIKSIGFLWLKSRSKNDNFNKDQWLEFSFI